MVTRTNTLMAPMDPEDVGGEERVRNRILRMMKKRVLKGETDVTQGQNKMLFQR